MKFCIKTRELVIPPSVCELLQKADSVKSNFIPSASDSQDTVFIRLRLTKALECSFYFLRRNLVDDTFFFYPLIIFVHVPKSLMTIFLQRNLNFSEIFVPGGVLIWCKKQRWKSRWHLNNSSAGEQPWPACPGTAGAALQFLWWVCRI